MTVIASPIANATMARHQWSSGGSLVAMPVAALAVTKSGSGGGAVGEHRLGPVAVAAVLGADPLMRLITQVFGQLR